MGEKSYWIVMLFCKEKRLIKTQNEKKTEVLLLEGREMVLGSVE